MSESLLKKEFKESDLQRVRNLITKKFGDSTKIQVGYQKENIEYKEGDIWEENNKKWTIKDGIKISVGKFDDLKKEFQLPLLCPNCNNTMYHKLDKKFYFYHKKCFNCVVEMEQQLRVDGKWEEYKKTYINNSNNKMLDELEKEMLDFLNNEETFVTEQGDIEGWTGKIDKEKIMKETREYIQNIRTKLNT